MKASRSLLVLGVGFCAALNASAEDPSVACLTQIRDNPNAQVLWSKYPFDVSKGQSLEVLSSTDRPSADERAALSFLATEGQQCLDLGTEWRRANYPTEVNALMETYRVNALSAMADLYAGKVTFGEMAKTRAKLASDFTNQMQAVVSKRKADQTAAEQRRQDVAEQRAYAESQARQQQDAVAQQQAESARRQAVFQLLTRPNPISLPQVPQPVTTNCWAAGNSVNCTTR